MSYIDLSNKSTKSDRVPEIDSLYAYHEVNTLKFTRHHQKGIGYRFTKNGLLHQAGADEIHIYHRTAEIRGVSKGLTMVTKNDKYREVQRWFNIQIEKIENDDKLFDKFSRAQTPTELGIKYD